MRTHVALLALSLVACGGGVTSDPASGPAPPPTGTVPRPPPPPPPTTAQSLICPGATISHADEVALWHRTDTDVVFVRHDGSSVTVHHAESDQTLIDTEVGAAGDHIGLLVRQNGFPSNLYLFDRRANVTASRTLAQPIYDLRVGANAVAYTTSVDVVMEGWLWNGTNEPVSLGKWLPVAPPRADGWVPARTGWDPDDEFGFVNETGELLSFPAKDPVYSVEGTLITVDKQAWELRIASPTQLQQISLAEFGAGDAEAPYIRETRREGWISLQRYPSGFETGDLFVVNVTSGETRTFPADPANVQPLAFYCNSGFPGYLASDGTLLRSHIAGGELQLTHDGEPVGFPLSNVAAVFLAERAGTIVMVGSDGSDTYCGTPESWPAKDGTLAGNSLQTLRHGEARVGEFQSSFDGPEIHVSGACTLTHEWGVDGSYAIRVEDLDGDASFDLAIESWAQWIE